MSNGHYEDLNHRLASNERCEDNDLEETLENGRNAQRRLRSTRDTDAIRRSNETTKMLNDALLANLLGDL